MSDRDEPGMSADFEGALRRADEQAEREAEAVDVFQVEPRSPGDYAWMRMVAH